MNMNWALPCVCEHEMLSYICSQSPHLHDAVGDGDGPLTVDLKLQAPNRSISKPFQNLRWSTSRRD